MTYVYKYKINTILMIELLTGLCKLSSYESVAEEGPGKSSHISHLLLLWPQFNLESSSDLYVYKEIFSLIV